MIEAQEQVKLLDNNNNRQNVINRQKEDQSDGDLSWLTGVFLLELALKASCIYFLFTLKAHSVGIF